MAPRLIWPRAKHRVGLERPHFWTRFRGQSDPWGRSSPQRDSFRCFARVRRWIPEEIGEEGKICVLHSRNRQLLHPRLGPRNSLSKTCNHCPCQSHRAKKVKSGGREDPTFWQSIRPKVLSGSLPPIAALWCACVCSRSARLRHSWPPESQASVKWASPRYFTATSPAISPSIEHTSTEMNQMNGPEGRDCARPRPCLRRERPRHLTYRASLALRVAPASGCRKSNGIFRPRKSSVRQ